MEFELLDPRLLKPHPSNVRKHPEEQIQALAAGFREFGFQGVVVIDEGGVILAGHGRQRASIAAGAATFDEVTEQRRTYHPNP